MIRSINFKPVRSDFQEKLPGNISNTKFCENMFIFAGKSTNLYEMAPEQYKTILTTNVTKIYRKAERSTLLNIDREAKAISKTLQMEKRMALYAERPAFISLKDHKVNFKHNAKCRLINPSKSEMGIVSKTLLEEINNKLNNHPGYNHWRSTSTVIE